MLFPVLCWPSPAQSHNCPCVVVGEPQTCIQVNFQVHYPNMCAYNIRAVSWANDGSRMLRCKAQFTTRLLRLSGAMEAQSLASFFFSLFSVLPPGSMQSGKGNESSRYSAQQARTVRTCITTTRSRIRRKPEEEEKYRKRTFGTGNITGDCHRTVRRHRARRKRRHECFVSFHRWLSSAA